MASAPKIVHCELDITDTELAQMVSGAASVPAQTANFLHVSAEALPPPTRKNEPPVQRAREDRGENPLLENQDYQELRSQEITAAFLKGLAVAGVAFGGYKLFQWMFSQPAVVEVASEI